MMTHIFLLLFPSLSWLLPHQSLHLFWPVQSWPYQEHASIPEINNQGILTTINVDDGDEQKNKIHANETLSFQSFKKPQTLGPVL